MVANVVLYTGFCAHKTVLGARPCTCETVDVM